MGKWITVEEGFLDIQPRYQGDRIREHILPGTFPFRYTTIAFVEDEEWEEMQSERGKMKNFSNFPQRKCERCQRPVKPQYRYCYRCNNYLQVKARIA